MAYRIIGIDHGSKEKLVKDCGAEVFIDSSSCPIAPPFSKHNHKYLRETRAWEANNNSRLPNHIQCSGLSLGESSLTLRS
jgi:hypothetical protein